MANLLITAGPTREPIDRVRFIGNRSSGRMGVAIAQAAADAGHDVTLLLGPAPDPESPETLRTRMKLFHFETTAELDELLHRELGRPVRVVHPNHRRNQLHAEVEPALRHGLLQLGRVDLPTPVRVDRVEPLLQRRLVGRVELRHLLARGELERGAESGGAAYVARNKVSRERLCAVV